MKVNIVRIHKQDRRKQNGKWGIWPPPPDFGNTCSVKIPFITDWPPDFETFHYAWALEKAQDSFGGKFELVSCQDNRCSGNYSTIAAPSLMSHFFYKSLLLCFSSKSYQSFVSWPPTDLPLLSCCNIKKDKIFKTIKTEWWVTALQSPLTSELNFIIWFENWFWHLKGHLKS